MTAKFTTAAIAALLAATALQPVWAQETTYPVTIQNGPYTFTVEEAPQRVVGLNAHATENLLALGLGDRMVGSAYNNHPVLDQYMDAFAQIPILAEQNPSLEVLLAVEPDFTYGRSSAYAESAVGPVETLQQYGVNAMVVEGTTLSGATMENVYNDLRNLGIIFDIQADAEALIADLQAEIAEVQEIVSQAEEPVDVLVYDSGTDSLYTAGRALQTHLIELAGGRNVFADLEGTWASVSWEEAVARNPDVIVINDYGDTPAEEKRRFLEENEALASIAAIQNGHIIVMPLPAAFEGVRNADAVRDLAEGFYPELF